MNRTDVEPTKAGQQSIMGCWASCWVRNGPAVRSLMAWQGPGLGWVEFRSGLDLLTC